LARRRGQDALELLEAALRAANVAITGIATF
jgi:hypothetical protein